MIHRDCGEKDFLFLFTELRQISIQCPVEEKLRFYEKIEVLQAVSILNSANVGVLKLLVLILTCTHHLL